MSQKAFRASFTLAAVRYIGPGDAAPGGGLPLGEGGLAVQAVAEGNDLPLPLVQAGLDAAAHPDAGVPGVQVLQEGVVHPDGVHEGEGAPLPLPVQGVGQGDVPLGLALGAEVHEHLIFDAPGHIGGQAHLPVGAEGAHPLDEADGADGDQVVLVAVGGVVLLHNVGHQAQVVLDELVAGLQVPLGGQLQAAALLLRLQGAGKGAGLAAGEAQGEEQALEGEDQTGWQHGKDLLRQ